MANESGISWKDKRKEQLRNEFVTTAIRLFRESGFDSVSVDDIVSATGVAKGTFYLYFKTKADIVQAALSHFLDDLEEQISAALSEISSDSAKSLRTAVSVIMHFLQENPGLITPVMSPAPSPETGSKLSARSQAVTASVFERLFRMGMLQGRYREIDPQIASHALRGMLAELIRRSIETQSNFVDIGETAVELFERGIRRSG